MRASIDSTNSADSIPSFLPKLQPLHLALLKYSSKFMRFLSNNAILRLPKEPILSSEYNLIPMGYFLSHCFLSRLQPGIVPLSDMAGEIVAIGSEVTNFSVGDRICANPAMPGFVFGDLGAEVDGVLAEFRLFDADPYRLVKFPDHLTYREASTLPCAVQTAYTCLHGPVPVKRGDVVLVQGTSGVSIAVLQFACAMGATVIVTSSSDEKLKVAETLGAQHGINYNVTPQWEEEVMKITNGKGANFVIDVGLLFFDANITDHNIVDIQFGGGSTLIQSLKACAIGGWVQLVGVMGYGDADLKTLPLLAISKNLCMQGVLISGVDRFIQMNQLIDLLKWRPYIDKEFTFEKAADAFRYMDGRSHVGKVVIQVSRD
ncbi:NAD P-binding protein [Mycena venus]|uniref:NAD P-binding protein n=1 Tax=Mycena venus TaxID=2733690 RepID=A0A8H7CMM3_9AGAR|nr:NAD P-binding protein [Mycena venus]